MRLSWIVGVLLVVSAAGTSFAAAPTDEAKMMIARWTAAYDAGDAETLVKLYTPDAVLLGTRSSTVSQGTDAVRAYFSSLVKPTTGNKVRFDDVRMIVAGDLRSVVVTGFYTFLRGTAQTPDPARFTWVLVNRGGEWLIAHHHSSVRPAP